MGEFNENKTYWETKLFGLKDKIVDYIPKLLIGVFIFVLFMIMGNIYKNILLNKTTNLINGETKKSKILEENLIYYQLGWIGYYAILTLGIIFGLVNMGFDLATIITILGSLGLAIGLALQETIKNIISGFYISYNNLFSIGDYISLKPLGTEDGIIGQVTSFSLSYTTLIDIKTNQITMVPNLIIQNNILTNITKSNYQ